MLCSQLVSVAPRVAKEISYCKFKGWSLTLKDLIGTDRIDSHQTTHRRPSHSDSDVAKSRLVPGGTWHHLSPTESPPIRQVYIHLGDRSDGPVTWPVTVLTQSLTPLLVQFALCHWGFMDSWWTCLDTADKKGPVMCYNSNQHHHYIAWGASSDRHAA